MTKWNADDFQRAILDSGIERIKFWNGWRRTWHGMSEWSDESGKPVALMLHHTAGAATESTNPAEVGNQCGADLGVARFVNRHPSFGSPASQFTIRRCGHLDVNAYKSCYHAGMGSFKGTYWESLGIRNDSANRALMGVEVVSRGNHDDFTEAQWYTIANLYLAMSKLAGWSDDIKLHTPRHRDWTKRKVDIRASRKRIEQKINEYARNWDGQVPDIAGIYNAEADPSLRNPAAWRLASRLADLGFFTGTVQPRGEQGYPARAMIAYNEVYGPNMADKSKYGPKAHNRIFEE